MLRIEGKTIQLTRGDTTRIAIVLEGRELMDGTEAVFTVKRGQWKHNEPVIRKTLTVVDNRAHVFLSDEETDIEPGSYVWDCRVKEVDDEGMNIFTPMEYGRFAVLEAIGDE